MRDLTRLPTNVVPSHYGLELSPDLDAATFTGTVAIDVAVHEPVDTVYLHALDLELTEVWLESSDGSRCDATASFDPDTETVALALAQTAQSGDWTIRADFAGVLNDKLVGFYRSTYTDGDGNEVSLACTQFESTHARRAFPCFDEPAFKATFSLRLVVPEGLMAVSNAAETQVTDLGDGRKRVQFARTMVMSTYLVAVVVGALEASETVDVDGVPLRIIAPPGKGDLTEFALDCGAFSLRFLADWYGIAYPGDKLDLVAIPDFAFGAMENLGCVTFRETALLTDLNRSTQAELQRVADVVAHEIAHMWFGDLVTMGWWNGIWLNEAFATFMEMLTTDAYRPEWQRWVDFALSRTAAFDTDSLSTTRPIEYEVVSAADAEAMFDVLTYEKGASVVRMLQQYLGEDRFQAGIRHYLGLHSYANTETTDLWDALEESSGEPVRKMMDSWIFRPGHPVISLERSPGSATVELSQTRFSFSPDPSSATSPAPSDVRSVPVVLRLSTDGDQQIHRVLLEGPRAVVSFDSAPDWIVGNHGGNGFYRVELSDDDLFALASTAATLDPIERYGLVEDEWALVLAGRGSLDRLFGVMRSLAGDDNLSVWQRITAVLGSLHRMATEDLRPDLHAWTRALVGPALARLGPQRRADEPERTTALRATLFTALAITGNDANCQADAKAHFAALGDDPAAVDADMADAVVRVVAATAGAATWDELRRRAASARTAQDRLRHHGAMADTDDLSLVERFREMCLTDEVRSQDALFLLRRALVNEGAASQTWGFIETNWERLTTQFPPTMMPRMIDGIRQIDDRPLAHQVAAFLAENPLEQGATVIGQHLERMWVSVALADRLRDEGAVALR